MIYASSTVTAAVVPYALYGSDTATVAVTYKGQTSRTFRSPIAPTAPGVFTANASGSGQAAALNENGSLNKTSNPAAIGSIIVLYATGEGITTPAGVDGKIAGTPPLPQVVQPVTVNIGGTTADLAYGGAAPTLVAGVLQINARIPPGITPGDAIPVQLNIGGVNAPTVTIAVSGQ
jgi:uncharacterized protein (TIGR03437 family)